MQVAQSNVKVCLLCRAWLLFNEAGAIVSSVMTRCIFPIDADQPINPPMRTLVRTEGDALIRHPRAPVFRLRCFARVRRLVDCNRVFVRLEESGWASGLEGRTELLGRWAVDAVQQTELDVVGVELLGVDALGLGGLEDGGLDDLDRRAASAVAGGEISIHLLDGASEGDVTVLLVHVVGTRAGVITDPEAEVLDVVRVLLEDLNKTNTE